MSTSYLQVPQNVRTKMKVEERSKPLINAVLNQACTRHYWHDFNTPNPLVNHVHHRMQLQGYGDISALLITPDHRAHQRYIEVKTERKFTGNLALETQSTLGRNNGWMHTCKADILLYCFLDRKLVYWMLLPKLKTWFNDNRGELQTRTLRDGKKLVQIYLGPIQRLIADGVIKRTFCFNN